MRIDNLHIENFRCFEDRTFFFDERFTLLIGANATGKDGNPRRDGDRTRRRIKLGSKCAEQSHPAPGGASYVPAGR